MVLFCLNDYALRHYINLKVSINQDVMMQDAPSFFSSFARLSAVFSCYFHKLYLWFKRALQINQLIKIMQIIIVNLANGHLSQKWHGRRISFAIIPDHYCSWWQLKPWFWIENYLFAHTLKNIIGIKPFAFLMQRFSFIFTTIF